MEFDRTLLTENYLIAVIECVEDNGYTIENFEFSTQRTKSYSKGKLDPKAVVYALHINTGIEKSYILGDKPDFANLFCEDLKAGIFDK